MIRSQPRTNCSTAQPALGKEQPATFPLHNNEEFEATDTLVRALVSPLIQALPHSGGRMMLDTNACRVQVGFVLLQKQPDGTTRRIDHWSRPHNETKQHYDTTGRKCPTVVWSVLLLRLFFRENRFTRRIDHNAFRWILNIMKSTERLPRRFLYLLEINFNVAHRAGVKHQPSEALSRLNSTAQDESLHKTTYHHTRSTIATISSSWCMLSYMTRIKHKTCRTETRLVTKSSTPNRLPSNWNEPSNTIFSTVPQR